MSTARSGTARESTASSGTPRSRAAGWWGLTFVLLLLVSAGMASVPGGADATSTVRDFYTRHTGVVVVAQLVGLLAAATFVPFTLTLRRGGEGRSRPDVEAAGWVVALAAVLTAVPVLWLTVVADSGSASFVHGLAVASDLTDVALFTAIALWAGTLVRASTPVWFRVLAGIVAVLSLVRAVLLLARSSALQVVGPMAFLVLVVVLSACVLARRSPLPSR